MLGKWYNSWLGDINIDKFSNTKESDKILKVLWLKTNASGNEKDKVSLTWL